MHSISIQESIRKVAVVDDKPRSLESIAEQILELDFDPVPVDRRFVNLTDFMKWITLEGVDAAVCDQKLQPGKLAPFYGAEAVKICYRNKLPAVLLTEFFDDQLRFIRPLLRYIPMVASVDEIELIPKGFEICIGEHEGEYTDYRKSWRTLLRIVDLYTIGRDRYTKVVIPGWDSDIEIELPLSMIPEGMQDLIKPGFRFYADTNKGAENQEEIFFANFSLE